MKTEIKSEALCLKTSLILFESDRFTSIESRTNGILQKRRGAVADKDLTTEDYMEQGNEFIIGTIPNSEKKMNSLIAIRKALTNEYDHLVDVYLSQEEAEEYRKVILEVNKFMDTLIGKVSYVVPKEEPPN